MSTYQPAVLIEGCLAFTSSASPLKPKLLLEQYLSMSRVAMDILTSTNFTSGLRAAPRITGDDQPRASTLLTAEMQKLGPSTGCLGSAPPCPTLSTCHLRKLTRVMCFCLSTCQPSSADQRPPCFISSASPLCGCSFCPGCTQTTATCCRAPARRRRAPAHCWAEFLSTYQPAVLIEGCLAYKLGIST